MIICLGATAANAGAPTKPPIVVSQVSWLNTLQGGGALASGNAAGTTFGVNPNGDILISTTYTNEVLLINGQTGAVTVVVNWTANNYNVGPIALDAAGNLYVGGLYTNNVIKVPYINGAYVAAPEPNLSGKPPVPANCTGTDTAECNFGSHLTDAANGYYFGVVSMAFDPAGNFFWAMTDANTTPNSIWECTVKCLATGTPSPALLYQEPKTTNTATIGQLNVGALAFDPWGNLFFTDAALSSAGSNESVTSNLNELAYSSSSKTYATKPTVLHTLTNAKPGSYDDELDGVAVDGNGTVYFATQYDGVFAFPNDGGTIDTTQIYGVSTQGAKVLSLDAKGNVYLASYVSAIDASGADTVARVSVNSLWAPSSALSTAVKATNVSVMVNDGPCTATGPTVTVAGSEDGVASTEFSGVVAATTTTGGKTTSNCSSQPGGGAYSATVTFTPAKVGERTALMTVTDTTNKGVGWANAWGDGEGALVSIDPGVWTDYSSGLTAPESISVDAGGNVAIADKGAGKVFWITNGKTTPVAVGTGFTSPVATAFDVSGNLYVADIAKNNVIEIPRVSGTLDTAKQTTVISDTFTFDGTALKSPSALGFGPDGVLYIADLGNARVVSYNPGNGLGAVRVSTGLSFPWGIAVDASNNLYVTSTGGGETLVYSGGGIVTSLKPSDVAAPWGVAVDASGSVYISDKATGIIARVPNVGGTLDAADAVPVQAVPSTALGIALDVAGNLYIAAPDQKSAYKVVRTAGAVAFGSVTDGLVGSQTIWVGSGGTKTLEITAPTAPAAPFLLGTASANACGAKLASGLLCELDVEYYPTGTAKGAETGSLTLKTNGQNGSTANIALSGTAVTTTLKQQTITFAQPAAVTYGVGHVALVATASSGLPVSFKVISGPGTLVNPTLLKVTGAGTIGITASQAGNSTTEPAPSVTVWITVNPAVLTVTAASLTKKQGGANPPLTDSITGKVNGDTSAEAYSGAPSLSTTATTTSPVGTYPIKVAIGTLTSKNYTFKLVDGVLTVAAN
jgi:sugar lactone lactonase YvrE